jgi:hypothetical protein
MSDLAELVSKSSEAYRNRLCHQRHHYYPVWFPRPELLQDMESSGATAGRENRGGSPKSLGRMVELPEKWFWDHFDLSGLRVSEASDSVATFTNG